MVSLGLSHHNCCHSTGQGTKLGILLAAIMSIPIIHSRTGEITQK